MSTKETLVAIGMFIASAVCDAENGTPIGYSDTPLQPNGAWRIHDGWPGDVPYISIGSAWST